MPQVRGTVTWQPSANLPPGRWRRERLGVDDVWGQGLPRGNTDPSRSYCDQLIAERTAIPFKASWKGLEPAQSPTESGEVVHRKESSFSESILPAIWNANRFQKPVQ